MTQDKKGRLAFRNACTDDIDTIVRLLADDPIGSTRENYQDPLPVEYHKAFAAITADPNNELIVAVMDRTVVGVLQLTFIPYLSHQGGWRALIESVRIDSRFRSMGLGAQLFKWALARAQERGCHMLQLTSDKRRPEAIRFYESLGFVASHEGLKIQLPRHD